MKKTMKRFFASLLAFTMMFATLSLTAAAEGEEFDMFIAIGADRDSENDWGLQYYGEGAGDNTEDIVATNAKAKVGDTVTIGLTMPTEVVYTWFMAPVLVAEGVSNVDYTIDSIKLDGEDILGSVDLAAGDAWWYEGTGPFGSDQSIRLAGGYNEWGTKYMAESPAGFTTIEYTITINDVAFGGGESGEVVLSEESYPAFIAIGADAEAENDWGFQYYGEGASSNAGDVVATNGELKSGETTTLTLEFPSPVVYTWFVAPCMIVDDSSTISSQSTFDVKVYLDGEEVAVDFAAGDLFWAEGTGDYSGEQCVRIAGGYNEWGAQYIEAPAGFSSIAFEITPTIYVGGAAEGETGSAAGEVDLNGTYHAYLGLQTPNWTYRDAWNSANGIGSDNWGQFVKNNDSGEEYGVVTDAVIAGNGTYTVSITDFGTIFADDFAAAGQDNFNLIYVDTDIPLSDAISITDVQLKIDGSTKHTVDVGYQSPDDTDYINIMIQNIWNSDIKDISYYPAPTTSLEITFTVSGFAYDAAPAEEAPSNDAAPAEDTTPAETPAADSEGGNTGLIIGIVAAVVVVAGGCAGVVVAKKKKGNK